MSSQAKALEIHSDNNLTLQELINSYPEELLLKIFDFLDPESIMKLTLVNKRWYDIVTNNISTMKKLTLFITSEKMMKKDLVVENRMFYRVSFASEDKFFNTKMLSSLNKIGSNVREIEFNRSCVSDVNVFQNILRNFPKVEKLKLKMCIFRIQQTNAIVLQLEHLKELELDSSCANILDFIEAQLKSLKVTAMNLYSVQDVEKTELHLMKFLYTQKRLETLDLTIKSTSSKLFAKNENAVYQFKLKELSLCNLEYVEGTSVFDDKNLKDFLLTQDSVEKLELRSIFSNHDYKLFLNKFQNVKTLWTVCPTDLKGINVNKNVTKLVLCGKIMRSGSDVQFFSIFPNLTDICFHKIISYEALSCLPNVCNNLTSLSLHAMSPGYYRNLKFSALKKFHLEFFEGGNDWSDLVSSNPTIESLSFRFIQEECDFNPDEIKKVIEPMPNLKHLILGGDTSHKMYLFKYMKKSIQISLTSTSSFPDRHLLLPKYLQ